MIQLQLAERGTVEVSSVKRRLSAILIADVVGYSGLMGLDEVGTVALVKQRWQTVVEPAVAGTAGRVVKYMGDGTLVEFGSAVAAVECALAIQGRMAEMNAVASESGQAKLRIGINVGDVIVDGDDILGDDVNIAARLESLCRPGELCVSANVYEAVRYKVGLSAVDLGEVDLKNIRKRVHAFRVLAKDQLQTELAPEEDRNRLSIAVLPFDNMSGVPEHDFIGDGIAENILTELSRFRDLTVIARNSSFAFKGRPTDVGEISRKLGVNFVLEGSVQKAGDRVRVTAQLIEGATGKHLWAERYDRRIDDLFALMDEITGLIVGTLGTTYGGRLRKVASDAAVKSGPASGRAFDQFVQGMQELNKFTKEGLLASLEHFKRAVTIDPTLAKAHAKTAWAHLIMINYGWSDDVERSWSEARATSKAALEADSGEAWVHWAFAGIELYSGNPLRALATMRRAVELNPNDADVVTDMGLFCALAGQAEDGVRYAEKGMRLNPNHPEYYEDQIIQVYYTAQRYDDAIAAGDKIRSLATPSSLTFLAASHAAAGDVSAARRLVDHLLEIEPDANVEKLTATEFAPYAGQAERLRLAENLRIAGLPE